MRKIIIAAVLLFLTVFTIAGRYYFISSYVKSWDGKICPRCIVSGIDISGQSRETAVMMLEDSIKYVYNKKITVKISNNSYFLEYNDLNPEFNIREVVNETAAYGNGINMFEKRKLIKSGKKRFMNLKFSYDNKAIKELLDKIENDINETPVNATIKNAIPGKFIITNEEIGRKIDRNKLYNDIVSMINTDRTDNVEIDAKVEEIKPEITSNVLKKINYRISSFSTNYGGSPPGRAANIELAVRKVNGKLVMPGEIFSFNEATGQRSASAGYQTAPVIYKNKLVDGLGGGVCQVSTTLYNAAIRCNLKSMQRVNHTLASGYIQPGFDATVADFIDYKFKNTLEYPILIEGFTKDGRIYFNIYSNSSLSNIKYELLNEVYEEIPPEIIYVKDPALPKGTMEKEESAHTGYKVKVYLVGYKNGKEISRKLISNDIYAKVDGVMRIGE